jgi:D-serine deaminase-like pyridoxal phosphate-dependent protein
VGKTLAEVPAPAVILDAAVLRRNCAMMLQATETLGVQFRPHIKTHKTTELARLQIGDDIRSSSKQSNAHRPVNLIASTVTEIEHMLPWLQECRSQGRKVNVLYGIPLAPSRIPRLAALATALGEDSIGIFIDHAEQIQILEATLNSGNSGSNSNSDSSSVPWPGKVPLHINIDVGYHREGVAADSEQLRAIATTLQTAKKCVLGGIYTHLGNSYSASSPAEALDYMGRELEGLRDGAVKFMQLLSNGESISQPGSKIVVSLGATPTAASIQNLLQLPDDPKAGGFSEAHDAAKRYLELINSVNSDFAVEFHAGVYPTLDMQQLATRARPEFWPTDSKQSVSTFANVGIRTLLEVASVYNDRGASTGKPEALIAAGSIALGREPCKSYSGWGVVSPWVDRGGSQAAAAQESVTSTYDPALPEGQREGWIVGRISQEHGILTWEGRPENVRPLTIGEKILIWPNHVS